MVDREDPDMDSALRRVGSMTITRLMTYGAYWKKWVAQRKWTSKGNLTALSLREQDVFRMDDFGEYDEYIYSYLKQLAQRRDVTRDNDAQYQ